MLGDLVSVWELSAIVSLTGSNNGLVDISRNKDQLDFHVTAPWMKLGSNFNIFSLIWLWIDLRRVGVFWRRWCVRIFYIAPRVLSRVPINTPLWGQVVQGRGIFTSLSPAAFSMLQRGAILPNWSAVRHHTDWRPQAFQVEERVPHFLQGHRILFV